MLKRVAPAAALGPLMALFLVACRSPRPAPAPSPGPWGAAPPAPGYQEQPWQPPSPAPQPSAPASPWWPPGLPNPGLPGPAMPGPGLGLPGLSNVPAVPVFGAAQQCVDIINQRRAEQRLAPLGRWYQNEPCAVSQAQSDGASRRPRSAFGRCAESAQNVCAAWPGPSERMTGACLDRMWAQGPGGDLNGHADYYNLANPRFTRVACGYATAPDGSTWAVIDLQ